MENFLLVIFDKSPNFGAFFKICKKFNFDNSFYVTQEYVYVSEKIYKSRILS